VLTDDRTTTQENAMAITPAPTGLARRRVLQLGIGSAGALVMGGLPTPAVAAPKQDVAAKSLDVLVSRRPVYGGLWEPNSGGQYLRLDRTYDPFLADYGEMWGRNFRIKTLTSYVGAGNQVFYSAAYNQSGAGQYLRLGRDYNGLLADFGEMWNRAFKLSALSAYVRDGQVFYDATYDPNTNGQGLYVHKTHDEFAAAYGDMWNRGFRLAGLTSFVVNGQVYYTGYFNPSTAGQYLRLWRGRDQFLREVAELRAQGFRPAVLSTHVLGGVVYYNAAYNQVSTLMAIDAWRKRSRPQGKVLANPQRPTHVGENENSFASRVMAPHHPRPSPSLGPRSARRARPRRHSLRPPRHHRPAHRRPGQPRGRRPGPPGRDGQVRAAAAAVGGQRKAAAARTPGRGPVLVGAGRLPQDRPRRRPADPARRGEELRPGSAVQGRGAPGYVGALSRGFVPNSPCPGVSPRTPGGGLRPPGFAALTPGLERSCSPCLPLRVP